jgi:hypothetical protein
MTLIMACIEAHPGQGEEVAVMDEVDVCVCSGSVWDISDLEERMGGQ